MTHYSPELITRCQTYFKTKCDIVLSAEEAVIQLDALSLLYAALDELVTHQKQ